MSPMLAAALLMVTIWGRAARAPAGDVASPSSSLWRSR